MKNKFICTSSCGCHWPFDGDPCCPDCVYLMAVKDLPSTHSFKFLFRRFLSLFLVFALLISFSLSSSASVAPTRFTNWKMPQIDMYTRSESKYYIETTDEQWDSLVLQAMAFNLQLGSITGVYPFSIQHVIFNGVEDNLSCIVYNASVSVTFPNSGPNTYFVGGRSFNQGETYNIGSLFTSVFPYGTNYTSRVNTNENQITNYVVCSDQDLKPVIVHETVAAEDGNDLESSIQSAIYILQDIRSYNSYLNTSLSYTLQELISQSSSIEDCVDGLDSILDSLSDVNDNLYSIYLSAESLNLDFLDLMDQLDDEFSYVQSTWTDTNEFLYRINTRLVYIHQELQALNTKMQTNNDILEQIQKDMEADKYKSIYDDEGTSFFGLLSGFFSSGFSHIFSLFKFIFMPAQYLFGHSGSAGEFLSEFDDMFGGAPDE